MNEEMLAGKKQHDISITQKLEVIFVSYLMMALFAVVGVVLGMKFMGEKYAVPLAFFLSGCGGLLSIWYFFVRKYQWNLSCLGFSKPAKPLKHLFWQIPLAILSSLIATAIVGSFLQLHPAIRTNAITPPVVYSHGADYWVLLMLSGLSIVFWVPFVEEILFRKLLTDVVSSVSWLRPAVVILVNSLIFSLAHVSPPIMLYIFCLGLFLNIFYQHYRSLWASFLLHMSNNGLVIILLLKAFLSR